MPSTPRHILLVIACLLGPGVAQDQKMPKDGPVVHVLDSGLRYSVLNKGDGGGRPSPGDLVRFHYSGWFEDGTLFETSRRRDEPLSQVLGVGMPKAWTRGLSLMSKGARYKVSVPAALCFGRHGSPGRPPDVPAVPPNTPVVFEFTLDSFEPSIRLPPFEVPGPRTRKISGGGLRFRVIRKADSKATVTPRNLGRFTVEFSMFNDSGQLVVTSRHPQVAHMTGRLAGGLEGPEFLAEAIGMLRVGERIRFEVPPERCYGKADRGYLCPPDSWTHWDLELLSLEAPPQPLPVPEFRKPDRKRQTVTASGLRYEVIEAGAGALVGTDANIEVHFAGWQTSGRLFDETFSKGAPLSVKVSDPRLIPGWTQLLPLMRSGSVFRFALSPALAYGSLGNRDLGIGPNRTLYYQVEVVRILK